MSDQHSSKQNDFSKVVPRAYVTHPIFNDFFEYIKKKKIKNCQRENSTQTQTTFICSAKMFMSVSAKKDNSKKLQLKTLPF